nr:hypothetical protein GCM10020063_022220 [Dactylosporangium thailandense]
MTEPRVMYEPVLSGEPDGSIWRAEEMAVNVVPVYDTAEAWLSDR